MSCEYPINSEQPVSLVVGSPLTSYLERYQSLPGISVVEMGPNTWSWIKNNPIFHRATWNYYRCLTHPVAGSRGTLVFEDDVRFAHGWSARLNCTLGTLEEMCDSFYVLALYAPPFFAQKRRQPGQLYVKYPYDQFFGTQGMYYPAEVRLGFAKYLKRHGVAANEAHYDLILRKYWAESGIPIFATAPCLIQHMGKTSAIKTFWHESTDFMEDVTGEPSGQVE